MCRSRVASLTVLYLTQQTNAFACYIHLRLCIYVLTTCIVDRHRQSQQEEEEESSPLLLLLGEGALSLKDPETGESTKQEDVLSTTAAYGATTDDKNANKAKAKVVQVPKGTLADDGSTLTAEGNKSVISAIIATNKPHIPRQNPCLCIFHLLQGLAALASLCLFISQLLPLLWHSTSTAAGTTDNNKVGILSAILKVYIAVICLAFILVEVDLPVPVIRNSTLLNAFWSRGFIYSFIGLVCTTEAYSERVDDLLTHSSQRFYIGWGPVFMQVASWLMFGIGCVYMVLGVCCLRGLRDKMKQKEKDAWKQYRQELRAWKQQRES